MNVSQGEHFCSPITSKGMYTYSLVFQVIDNKTQIHIRDIRVTIKRTRNANTPFSHGLIAIAKARAEKQLFETMAAKVAKELNTTTDGVIRATEKGMLFVCVPYSLKYVGIEEK